MLCAPTWPAPPCCSPCPTSPCAAVSPTSAARSCARWHPPSTEQPGTGPATAGAATAGRWRAFRLHDSAGPARRQILVPLCAGAAGLGRSVPSACPTSSPCCGRRSEIPAHKIGSCSTLVQLPTGSDGHYSVVLPSPPTDEAWQRLDRAFDAATTEL